MNEAIYKPEWPPPGLHVPFPSRVSAADSMWRRIRRATATGYIQTVRLALIPSSSVLVFQISTVCKMFNYTYIKKNENNGNDKVEEAEEEDVEETEEGGGGERGQCSLKPQPRTSVPAPP